MWNTRFRKLRHFGNRASFLYAWTSVKLKTRLHSQGDVFSGSVNWNIFIRGGGHWGVFNTVIPQANFVNNRSFESKIENTVYRMIFNIVIPQFFKENAEIP
jgi:hypothetical protein